MECQIVLRAAWNGVPCCDFSFGRIVDGQYQTIPLSHLVQHAKALTTRVHFDAFLGTKAFIEFKDVLPFVCLSSVHKSFVRHEYYGNMIVVTLNLPEYVAKEEK